MIAKFIAWVRGFFVGRYPSTTGTAGSSETQFWDFDASTGTFKRRNGE